MVNAVTPLEGMEQDMTGILLSNDRKPPELQQQTDPTLPLTFPQTSFACDQLYSRLASATLLSRSEFAARLEEKVKALESPGTARKRALSRLLRRLRLAVGEALQRSWWFCSGKAALGDATEVHEHEPKAGADLEPREAGRLEDAASEHEKPNV